MASNSRVWLDLLSSVLGVAAGVVVLAVGFFGPITAGSSDLGVAAMGLLGAGFAAVGVGHFRIEATYRGVGEILAGVGAISFGISYLVSPATIPFVLGVLGLGVGGAVLAAESFDLIGDN